MPILEALERAGPKGLQAGEISRLFEVPDDIVRRAANTNTLLMNLAKVGRVRRSAQQEPSAFYNNVPAYRWYITGRGVAYYRTGGYEGRRAEVASLREARQLARERRLAATRNAAADFAAIGLPHEVEPGYIRHQPDPETRRRRDELMVFYRREGLTLAIIGRLAGTTRERVRQVVLASRR